MVRERMNPKQDGCTLELWVPELDRMVHHPMNWPFVLCPQPAGSVTSVILQKLYISF